MRFTSDTIDYEKMRVGDTVSGDVVEYGMNALPPVSMRNSCSQIGEPVASFPDENGKWRNTFYTYELVDYGKSSDSWNEQATWRFCGCCFAFETTNRYGWYELDPDTRETSCYWYIKNVINR